MPRSVSPDSLDLHFVERQVFTGDLQSAFASFLALDVANGDATADTVKAYVREVAFFLRWCLENGVLPAAAKRADIESYREHLKAQGQKTTTRQHKLSIVRRFYEGAVKNELIRVNPAASVKGGKDLTAPEENMKALSAGALAALLGQVPAGTLSGIRDRAVIGLMAIHGLRRVEVHRLDHESINREEDAAWLRVHGKGNKIRRVYLRPDTLAAIDKYIHGKMEAGLPLSEALFLAHGPRTRGDRLSRRSLNWIVDTHLCEANLKKAGVSCHALRHTFGTLSVAGGAKLEHLKDAMGHANLETTGMYVRAVERRKNNPANFIDIEI